VRTKTPAQMIAELDRVYAAGWRRGVFFVDDNFIGNARSLKTDLLPAIIAWREKHPDISFNTEASINLADDPELMDMMVAAGFDMVFIGLETPDDEGLAECNKKQNLGRDLVADVKRIQQAGMQVQGGFIVGFDSDKPSIFQRQVEFIQKSGIVTAMVGLLQAIPGTHLHDRMQREGRLVGLATGDNVDGTTNIRTLMNADRLREGYRGLLARLYAPKEYYRRIRTFLREYKAPPRSQRAGFAEVKAFLRSLVRLGVIGRGRFHYWGLLIWTRLRRPNAFGLAVTLAITGYHHRKVFRQHVLKPTH